jgi:hypothetical protein
MSSFHDDKLWQMSFTALLDLLEMTDDMDSDLAVEVRKQGMMILTEVARAVAIRRGVEPGITAPLRSLLSVMWAREMLTDDEFAKLDGAYEVLSNKLPR